MAPKVSDKSARDHLAPRLESLRRHGHLDPAPTSETPVTYPPRAPHPTGIPYAPVAPAVYTLAEYRALLKCEAPLPRDEVPECCRDPGSICAEVRALARSDDDEPFRAFFGPLRTTVLILDLSATGKDARAMYTETIELGTEFVADWDHENR